MLARRRILQAAASIPTLMLATAGTLSKARAAPAEDWAAKFKNAQEEALAAFPYERLEVEGRLAMQEWERLKTEGRGVPVIVGDDESFSRIAEQFHPSNRQGGEPAVILAKASQLTHPDSLIDLHRAREQEMEAYYQENPEAQTAYKDHLKQLRSAGIEVDPELKVPLGTWPDDSPAAPGLTVLLNWQDGGLHERANIVLLPTDDWTEAPAYLRWGGWNENPPPEYHVAALRLWRDRYGAELIGMGPDVLNIRVESQPQSREEALALAPDHFRYCPDTVLQGVGTLSNLAAALKANDWWFFWWD